MVLSRRGRGGGGGGDDMVAHDDNSGFESSYPAIESQNEVGTLPYMMFFLSL